jgi:hypothetical protein
LIESLNAGVVLTAEVFNPSIFTQVWLADQGIANRDEFQGASISTAEVSQHILSNVQILVVPPKIEVGYRADDEEAAERAAKVVVAVAQRLPHTPYKAIGVNFAYSVTLAAPDQFPSFNRELFLPSESALAEFFSGEDARFGGYFSSDFLGARLKLDVKPLKKADDSLHQESLLFAFNFHSELGLLPQKERVEAVERQATSWRECFHKAQEVLNKVESKITESRNPSGI